MMKRLTEMTLEEWNKYLRSVVKKTAEEFDLQPSLVWGIIQAESDGLPSACRYEAGYKWLYKPKEVKPGGCSLNTEKTLQKCSIGLMQVMGAVYREYGYRGWLTELFCDIEKQLHYGCKHLKHYMEKYGTTAAISAYNAGGPTEKNRRYVEKVLKHAEEWFNDFDVIP